MTANCPAPVVRIDRSFAHAPPRCVDFISAFSFKPNAKWIEALADGTGQITTQSECLGLVADWIAEERIAREVN